MWALQFLALLVYFAGLAFGVVLLNVAVLAVAIWVRSLLISPRGPAGARPAPSRAPAPAGTLSAPLTSYERRWRA